MSGREQQQGGFARTVLLAAIDRGLVTPRVGTRAIANAANLSHETVRRWVRGDKLAPENDARLREVLGLERQQEDRHR